MNFLITGACGFIGSHTLDTFIRNKHRPVVVDNLTYAGNLKNVNTDKCDFYRCDIADSDNIRSIFKKHKIDVVINLAAETHVDNSIKNADIFVKTNVCGVLNLLNACKEFNSKFVQISTDEVYGPASIAPFGEDAPLNPMNPYSASKASADHLILSYQNTFGINYKIIRPSNNFGPRQNSEKFIPKILKNISSSNLIPLYGDGEQKRQWTFVKDTAQIIYDITTKCPDNKIYNVGDDNIISNIDLLKKIIEMTGADIKLIKYVPDRPGHDRMYWIKNDAMKGIIEPSFSNFEKSLTETIRETL